MSYEYMTGMGAAASYSPYRSYSPTTTLQPKQYTSISMDRVLPPTVGAESESFEQVIVPGAESESVEQVLPPKVGAISESVESVASSLAQTTAFQEATRQAAQTSKPLAVAPALTTAAQNMAVYLRQKNIRQGMLTRLGKATAAPGATCSPPEGGIVRKLYARIPRSQAELMEQQAAMAPILGAGCLTKGRMYDLQNMELCCPPNAQVGLPVVPLAVASILKPPPPPPPAPPIVIAPEKMEPTAPPVPIPSVPKVPVVPPAPAPAVPPVVIAPDEMEPTAMEPPPVVPPVINGFVPPPEMYETEEFFYPEEPPIMEPPITVPPVTPPVTNGNGVEAEEEEKKYFGLTPMQLGLAAVVGAGALYFLVLRK